MILVVVMNSIECRLYTYKKGAGELSFIRELTHLRGKLKDSELTSDKPGHYKANSNDRGAYSPRTDPHENEINIFTRDIAKELNDERNKNAYDKLIIIAPPNVSGMLFQHLDKHVKELITNHFQKDYVYLNDKELAAFLQEHANFPDKHSL